MMQPGEMLVCLAAVPIPDGGRVIRPLIGIFGLDPGEHPATAVVREVVSLGKEIRWFVVLLAAWRAVPERISGVYLTRVIQYPDGNRLCDQ